MSLLVATALAASPLIVVTAPRETIEDLMPDHPCYYMARVYTDAHGTIAANVRTDSGENEHLSPGTRVMVCGSGYRSGSHKWVIYPGQTQTWADCEIESQIEVIGVYRGPCTSGWMGQLKVDKGYHRD